MATPAHRLEHVIHWVLLGGSAVSGVLLAAGVVLFLYQGQPLAEETPPDLHACLRAAQDGSGLGLVSLGLIVLMATPVLRVAALAVGWALERDWRFAAVASLVLVLLGGCVWLGVG